MNPPLLLTPAQAAEMLSISTKHLRALTNAGRLRYIDVGSGLSREARRYAVADLEAFVAESARRTDPQLSAKLKARAIPRINQVTHDFQALRESMPKRKPKNPFGVEVIDFKGRRAERKAAADAKRKSRPKAAPRKPKTD